MRQTLSSDAFSKIMPSGQTYDKIWFMMGYQIELFGMDFSWQASIIYVIVVTLVFFGIAVLLTKKK